MPSPKGVLWKQALKILREASKKGKISGLSKKSSVKELSRSAGVTREELNQVKPEALEGIKRLYDLDKFPEPGRHLLRGLYSSGTGEMGITPEALMSSRSPSTMAHEIGHHIRTSNRKKLPLEHPDRSFTMEGEESAAEDFAQALIRRKHGEKLESIPAEWRKYLLSLGVTGAAGYAAFKPPKEAEAMSLKGEVLKQGVKAVGRKVTEKIAGAGLSSTSKVLSGREIDGKVVQRVVKGSGKWRHMIFEDGTQKPITQEEAKDYTRHFALKDRLEYTEGLSEAEALAASKKSMDWRDTRQGTFVRRGLKGTYQKNHEEMLGQAGVQPNKKVWVWSKGTYYPEADAARLEQAGLVKIKPPVKEK